MDTRLSISDVKKYKGGTKGVNEMSIEGGGVKREGS